MNNPNKKLVKINFGTELGIGMRYNGFTNDHITCYIYTHEGMDEIDLFDIEDEDGVRPDDVIDGAIKTLKVLLYRLRELKKYDYQMHDETLEKVNGIMHYWESKHD